MSCEGTPGRRRLALGAGVAFLPLEARDSPPERPHGAFDDELRGLLRGEDRALGADTGPCLEIRALLRKRVGCEASEVR